MSKIDIKNIHLGKTTAEKEVHELHNYFLSTRAYLNAKDNNKRKLIYIGSRGAGKSALFNQIAHEYENSKNIIIKIHPVEYSYDTFKKMNHDFYDIKAAYSIAWHYMLLIYIFQETVKYFEERKYIKANRDNIDIISNYLVKNNFKEPGSGLDIFLKFLSKIGKAKLSLRYEEVELAGSINLNNVIDTLDMNEIKRPLAALKTIAYSYPIYIFVDELDTGWNNTNEAKNYISGLLYGIIKINAEPNINVFLSLRQDMYNNLSSIFKDTEKIRDDIEFLKWDKRQLESLICFRIKDNRDVKELLNNTVLNNNEEILNLIFEEGVFDYIVKNTLQRPRELIHFCNQAIEKYSEEYIERALFSKKIDMEIIHSIENQISLDRINDFCKEYEDEYPHIDSLLWHFEGKTVQYKLDQFIHEIEIALLSLDENHPEKEWIKSYWEKPLKLIVKLFEIGFIKIKGPHDNSYYASYQKNTPHNFKIVESIRINNIFRSALQLN